MGQNVIIYPLFHIYYPGSLHVEMPFLVMLSEVHPPKQRWNQTSIAQSNTKFYFFALTDGRFCRKRIYHLYTTINHWLIISWLSVSGLSVTVE